MSEDKQKAFLSLIATVSSQSDILRNVLAKELINQGIKIGIKEEVLDSMVVNWNRNKKTQDHVLIAEGTSPEGGINLEGVLSVKGVTNLGLYNSIKELKRYHIHDIEDVCMVDRVDAGTVILEAQGGDEGEFQTVYGEGFSRTEYALRTIKMGEGIQFNSERKIFSADRTGAVVLLDNYIEVIPVEFDGQIYAKVDSEKMNVMAELYPSHFTGNVLTKERVAEVIKKMGIKEGIQDKVIIESLNTCNQKKEKVVVAVCKGVPAENGKDGWVEHLIDFHQSLQPTLNTDGSADFKSVSLIKPVEPGQHLARYHEATLGNNGYNLEGISLPARDGRDIKLPKGENTEISLGDANLLLASISGNARIHNQLVEVSECYVVEGDVDFSTGSIDHPKTVVVKKDVKATFDLNTGGDLEVLGILEDCKIKSKGDVLIKAGFLGNGDGVIESEGEVGIGFVRNQMVRCRKSLFVGGEAMNSRLYSRRNIEVGGKTIGIVGGIASARNEIICETAGNESGTRTELQVGVDFVLVDEKSNTDKKIKELLLNKAKLDPHLDKLIRIKSLKRTLPPKEMGLLKQLVTMQSKIKRQLKELEERKELIGQKLADISQSKVIVKGIVYPGVVISIGNYSNQIKMRKEGGVVYVLKHSKVIAL